LQHKINRQEIFEESLGVIFKKNTYDGPVMGEKQNPVDMMIKYANGIS
jgi:hypothetical protein